MHLLYFFLNGCLLKLAFVSSRPFFQSYRAYIEIEPIFAKYSYLALFGKMCKSISRLYFIIQVLNRNIGLNWIFSIQIFIHQIWQKNGVFFVVVAVFSIFPWTCLFFSCFPNSFPVSLTVFQTTLNSKNMLVLSVSTPFASTNVWFWIELLSTGVHWSWFLIRNQQISLWLLHFTLYWEQCLQTSPGAAGTE